MAWAANFDDFLNLPASTSGAHYAFSNADPTNVITEPSTIAELYPGMPLAVRAVLNLCLICSSL